MKTAEIEQLIEHAIYSTFKKSGAKTSILLLKKVEQNPKFVFNLIKSCNNLVQYLLIFELNLRVLLYFF
jgi:hypothetical protein